MTRFFRRNDQLVWMRQRLGISALALGALIGVNQFRVDALPKQQTVLVSPSTAAMRVDLKTETNASSGPRSVPPTGWRRTTRGWEQVANWPQPRPTSTRSTINELIATQKAMEPKWLQALMEAIRQIPPLVYAVAQLAAVGLIVKLGERRRA